MGEVLISETPDVDLVNGKAVQALWTVIRPGYMVALFLLGWAANVGIFARYRVDYTAVLGLGKDEFISPRCLAGLAMFITVALSLVRLAAFTWGPSPSLLLGVLTVYLLVLIALATPLLPEGAAKHVRWRGPFARALRRCIWPDASKEIPFVEVLLADGLCSMAKLFFDLALGSCMVASAHWPLKIAADVPPPVELHSNTSGLIEALPTMGMPRNSQGQIELGLALDECSRSPLPFLAWFLPFVIRARQCFVTSRHAPDNLSRDLQKVNLMKYLSALPVVFFAMCHAGAMPGIAHSMLDAEDYEAMWAMASVVNAVFSFLWDMVMDWGLLQPIPGKSIHFGLRPLLLYPVPVGMYYFAIVLNFVGRMLWSLRWSEQATVFLGSFFLSSLQQAAEVLRRCMWNIIRVEWQCICKGKVPRTEKAFPV
eukprot:gb/GFBE01000437.1/.p1 GENE.gb/GFBE01000437.1/~~gb/GFBE01000437.1/.p1  ORF type:complete len:425 (+),score=65.75 gb/GFBE01000437.1/:1-1275(+)